MRNPQSLRPVVLGVLCLALLGCEDLIVVHTKRATLVMPASRAQDLKQLRDRVPEDLR